MKKPYYVFTPIIVILLISAFYLNSHKEKVEISETEKKIGNSLQNTVLRVL